MMQKQIELRKYEFIPYNKKYKIWFESERKMLKKCLGKETEIAHIGSTAVPGLGGKGVLDLVVAVPKTKIKKTIEKLKKINYTHYPFTKDDIRKYLEKVYNHKKETKAKHIHLTPLKSRMWQRVIAVREYLKKHKEELQKYNKIKKRGLKLAKNKGKIYRAYKNKFLKELTKKALAEYRGRK